MVLVWRVGGCLHGSGVESKRGKKKVGVWFWCEE